MIQELRRTGKGNCTSMHKLFSFLPKDLKAHNVTKILTVSQWLTKFSQFYIFSDN